MSKKIILKSIFDGLAQSLILIGLGVICVSDYSSALSLKQLLILGVLCTIPSTAIYAVFALKETKNNKLVYFSLTDAFCFALCIMVLLIIGITFNFEFLNLQETNNANGIMLLFTQVCYILVSFVLRIFCFVLLIVTTHRTNRKH